jgi:hypothetical protein
MDYLVKIRSVQTPLNGQFSIGANTRYFLAVLATNSTRFIGFSKFLNSYVDAKGAKAFFLKCRRANLC